jgi:3-deoxy-manno-octulosonate cytidylyltransferase (CMP-KDO synthetase)
MNERIIAIIPARYSSSRFPGKMLAPIMGKSLLQRTYEQVKACQSVDDILIATDNDAIFEHVQSFGGQVVMTKENHPTGTDRIIEAVQNHAIAKHASIILNVQGDEPCIEPEILTLVCQALINNPNEVMATVAVKTTNPDEIQSASVVKCVMDQDDHALYFSRSPIPGIKPKGTSAPFYYKHMGIYAFRKDFLIEYGHLPQTPLQLVEDLEQLKVLEAGYKIKVVYAERCSPAVDVPEDIQRVTEWLCNQNLYS